MRKLFSMPAASALIALMGATFCSSVSAQWGTMTGQILLEGDVPVIKPIAEKGDKSIKDSDTCSAELLPDEKLVIDPETKGIANVVVYLAKKPSMVHPNLAASKDKEVVLDQKYCRFIPHVSIVRTDQQLRVLSDDGVAHNTHTFPVKNNPENFVVAPNDRVGNTVKPMKLVEKTPTKVTCDIHSFMKAYLVILDHPYAAVTNSKGEFEIADLPVGTHEFMVWQEESGWLDKKYSVTIKAGANPQKPLKYTAAQILK